MLVQNVGLFWEKDDVYWGGRNNPGCLLGKPCNQLRGNPIDFREQAGIYVLYADYQMIYVGQTGAKEQKLLFRLRQHLSDDLAGRWDRFSWFGIRRILKDGSLSQVNQSSHSNLDDVLNHMEAILIHAAEPPLNRQGGKFGAKVTRVIQFRDEERLGLNRSELLKHLKNEVEKIGEYIESSE